MTYTQEDGHEEYQLLDNPNMVLRVSDQAFIPFDDANTDYQAYKQWLEEGNKPKSPEQKVQK